MRQFVNSLWQNFTELRKGWQWISEAVKLETDLFCFAVNVNAFDIFLSQVHEKHATCINRFKDAHDSLDSTLSDENYVENEIKEQDNERRKQEKQVLHLAGSAA